MNLLKKILVIFIFICLQITSLAHGDEHKDKEKSDTAYVVNGDTIAINGIPTEKFLSKKLHEDSLTTQVEEKDFEINYIQSVFEHLHNKIVHFPLAFILAAFLFSIINLKSNMYELVVKILVSLSIFFAIAAFVTGSEQIAPFQNSPKEWISNLHRILGISTIIVNFIWLVFLNINPLKRYSIFVSFFASILVLTAGFYGGIISH